MLLRLYPSASPGQVLIWNESLHGRPSWVEIVNAAADLSSVTSYTPYYIHYNWHGDAVAFAHLTGGYAGTYGPQGVYDPWGNPSLWPSTTLAAWNYYRWAGAWGYMKFDDLGLYYIHGRWYNPDCGRRDCPLLRLKGPETLGAGCVAGAGGSILVGEAVLVHGLSVEGVSWWNAKEQVLSLIQAKGKGGGGGANWRPTDTGEYVRVRKLTDAEVKARGWERLKQQYGYGPTDSIFIVTEGPLKGKTYIEGAIADITEFP